MPLVVTKIDSNGRVALPAEYRRALGLEPGDRVVVELCDEELHVVPHEVAVKRMQELIARYIPKERSLVDELIAERRAEAARE